jgi:hypothetical protein
MGFAHFINQNVPRFDVSMQNAVFMRVMNSTGQLHDKFGRAPNRYRLASDHFVKLASFDEVHAEVALPILLAHLVDGNDARMVKLSGSFRFPSKALQMRFGSPRAQANYFERNGTIETLLVRPINHPLPASTDFFQQLVIAKVSQHFRRARTMTSTRGLRWIGRAFMLFEQTKTGLQKASPANVLRRIGENLCAALPANAISSLHIWRAH